MDQLIRGLGLNSNDSASLSSNFLKRLGINNCKLGLQKLLLQQVDSQLDSLKQKLSSLYHADALSLARITEQYPPDNDEEKQEVLRTRMI